MIQNQALEFALLQIYEIAEAILCFRWVEGALVLSRRSKSFALARSTKKGKLLRANGGCLG